MDLSFEYLSEIHYASSVLKDKNKNAYSKDYLWQDFLWSREEISVDDELRGYIIVLLLQQQTGLSAFVQ